MARMNVDKLVADVAVAVERRPQQATAIWQAAIERVRRAIFDPDNRDQAHSLRAVERRLVELKPPPVGISEQFDSAMAVLSAPTVNSLEQARREKELAGLHGTGKDIDDLAGAKALQTAREDAVQTSIAIAPPSIDQAALGNSAKIMWQPKAADLAAGVVQAGSVLQWQGTRRDAQAFTIDIDVLRTAYAPYSNPNATSFSSRPYALVRTGSGGFVGPQIEVDVGMGVRIVGKGTYAEVTVAMGQPGLGNPPPGSGVVLVGASLGFFAAPTAQSLTRTAYADAVQPGAPAVVFNRPYRAVAVSLPYMTVGAGQLQVDFLDATGTPVYTRTYQTNSPLEVVELTDDVTQVTVTNLGNVAASYRLPFFLSM